MLLTTIFGSDRSQCYSLPYLAVADLNATRYHIWQWQISMILTTIFGSGESQCYSLPYYLAVADLNATRWQWRVSILLATIFDSGGFQCYSLPNLAVADLNAIHYHI